MATWRIFKKEANRTRFTITGKDHLGVIRQMPAFAREDLSIELVRNVATLVEHKRHNSAPPPLLAMWMQGLAPDIKAKFIEFGPLDSGTIPLRMDTAIELKAHLANKVSAAPAFNMPLKDSIIRMLRADLKAAGIPYSIDEKHGKVVDFHSLRHTCALLAGGGGRDPKVIQRIVRHSTITLTMDRYAHAFKGDEVAAVAELPSLSTLPATLALTETDGASRHAAP